MPERNHEVIIDSHVYPDVVTVTLSNDDFIDSRDYVGKELYESVIEANAAWQAENAKLRELVETMASRLRYADEVTGGGVLDARLKRQLRELGIEVDG